MIHLDEKAALGQGKSRLIFQHPDHTDQLIKVIRPDVIEDRFGSGTKWYKRLRRFGRFISYQREIAEYLAVRAKLDKDPEFLPKIVGFVDTTLGLGLVSVAVKDENGQLAPPLSHLLKEHRYDDKVAAALETCFQQLLDCPVILSDLNVGNFVYLEKENRFVMIDGMGDANLLPLKAFIPAYNRRAKLKRYERFRQRIERYKRSFNYPS